MSWRLTKVFFSVGKTDLALFISRKNHANSNLEIKLNRKKLNETNSNKYLTIQINENLHRNNALITWTLN